MSQTPEPGSGYTPLPPQENTFLGILQHPRIVLFMLAGWALMSFLVELAPNSAFFVENHNEGELSLDGIFGGLALNWEGIPLAVLYIYCSRDPERFRGVFWLALIAMGASVASNLYHWLVTDTYSIESVFLPVTVSTALGVLVFLHLFRAKEGAVEAVKA